MVGPKANIVSACVASGTEGVEARGVMKTSRETVDWPWPVRITRAEELLHRRSGWMQEKPSRALSERLGEDFFLDIPSHRTHRRAFLQPQVEFRSVYRHFEQDSPSDRFVCWHGGAPQRLRRLVETALLDRREKLPSSLPLLPIVLYRTE